MLIFFAVIDLHGYMPDIKKVSFALLVVNAVILLLIPFVIYFNLTDNLYFSEYREWASNFKGFFSVHITYGTFLVMVVLLNLSIAYHCYSNNKIFQKVVYALCVLLCFSIALTSSRSAWLALIFSLMFFFVTIRRAKYVITSLALIGVVIGGMYLCDVDAGFVSNFKSRLQLALNGNSNGRFHIWEVGSRIIMDNPFLGVGNGGVQHYFPLYDKNTIYSNTAHLHNLYLNIWAELGLAGLLAFTWLLIRIFKVNIALYKKSSLLEAKAISLAVILITYSLMVVSFTEYNFFKVEISRFFWFITGYAGYHCLRNESEA